MRLIIILIGLITFTLNSNAQCGNGKILHLGPKGGCYFLTPAGNRSYVNRECCDHLRNNGGNKTPLVSPPKRDNDSPCGTYKNHILFRGPRGGCYYINKNGNKSYIEKSLCRC